MIKLKWSKQNKFLFFPTPLFRIYFYLLFLLNIHIHTFTSNCFCWLKKRNTKIENDFVSASNVAISVFTCFKNCHVFRVLF